VVYINTSVLIKVILVSEMKSPYLISKLVNTRLILLEVHGGYTLEVRKCHTNYRWGFICV